MNYLFQLLQICYIVGIIAKEFIFVKYWYRFLCFFQDTIDKNRYFSTKKPLQVADTSPSLPPKLPADTLVKVQLKYGLPGFQTKVA